MLHLPSRGRDTSLADDSSVGLMFIPLTYSTTFANVTELSLKISAIKSLSSTLHTTVSFMTGMEEYLTDGFGQNVKAGLGNSSTYCIEYNVFVGKDRYSSIRSITCCVMPGYVRLYECNTITSKKILGYPPVSEQGLQLREWRLPLKYWESSPYSFRAPYLKRKIRGF